MNGLIPIREQAVPRVADFPNPALYAQVARVAEVFPDVPAFAIEVDLQLTASPEATIDNILAGRAGHE